MKLEEALCRRCRLRLEILKLLGEGPSTFSELARRLSRRPERWAWGRRHLRSLEEAGLVAREDSRWRLTEAGRRLLSLLADPPRPPKLYFAGAASAVEALRALTHWIGAKVPYLLSAGICWMGRRFSLGIDLSFASEVFVDSGAQQFLTKFKATSYPYSAREYVKFASQFDLVATLDLPLDILASRGLSVKDGIAETVRLGVEVIEEAERLGVEVKVVPVLQGYDDPSQWLECLDLYRDHGVRRSPSGMWGVGSLCMAKGYRLAKSVLEALRGELCGERLHVFGLSLTALKKVYRLIDSFDTAAWVYWAKVDGARLDWDPVKGRFIHLQARDGKRYDTLTLMVLNAKALLEAVNSLSHSCTESPFRTLKR